MLRAEWSLEFVPRRYGTDTAKVIGTCSNCGCTDAINHYECMGYVSNGETPVIWSGYITNFFGNEETAEGFAIHNAQQMKNNGFLRKYCPDCGAKMI